MVRLGPGAAGPARRACDRELELVPSGLEVARVFGILKWNEQVIWSNA
jgi:hypothetical protein